MKKITLMLLVAMVPFLTMAQKRSKKDKTEKTHASYEFMVITGYQMMPPIPKGMDDELEGPHGAEIQAKLNMSANMDSQIRVVFDLAGVETEDVEEFASQQYRSMSAAVNSASKYGWEFVNANIVSEGNLKIHYYYLQRKK